MMRRISTGEATEAAHRLSRKDALPPRGGMDSILASRKKESPPDEGARAAQHGEKRAYRPIPKSVLDPGKHPPQKEFGKKAPGEPGIPRWFLPHGARNVADGGASVLTPLFIKDALGGNVGMVGVVSAAVSMASVPAAVAWGELSDRFQKRKLFILLGYFGTGLMYILMGLSMGELEFLGLNVIYGVVAAASVPIGTLIITETMPSKRWPHYIGAYTRMGGMGWIIGLLIGGIWLEVGASGLDTVTAMRLLFIMLGAVGILGGFMAMKMIPEPPVKPFAPHRVDKLVMFQGRIVERVRYLPLWMYKWRYRGEMHRIRTSGEAVPKPLKLYFAASLLLFSGFQTVFTPFPIFMSDRLGTSGLEIFLVYLVNSMTAAYMYSRVGDIIPRFGEKASLIKANIIRAGLFAGFGLLALLTNYGLKLPHLLVMALLFGMMAGVGFFWAFVSVASLTLVSRCAPAGAKGENVGLFNATVSIGGIVGSLAGGYVALALGYPVSFFTGTGLVVAGIVMLSLNRGLDELGQPSADKEWKEPDT